MFGWLVVLVDFKLLLEMGSVLVCLFWEMF